MVSGRDTSSYRLLSKGVEKKLPVSIIEWVNSSKKERGVHVTDHEGIHFLLIATGLKPNPGHRLVVEQMKENTLYIREVPPAEGSMAPQVVTYPYLLLKGKGNPPQVLDSITGKQLIIADP